MKGSSAMPHKRNPKVAERISGLARVVRAACSRRLRERPALARARHLALLRRADRHPRRVPRARLHARPLRVDRRRPRRLSGADGAQPLGLATASSSRTACCSRSSRAAWSATDAYRLVQRNAMRAWDEERDFRELVRADAEIAAHLDAGALDEVFDLDATIAHLDSVFDRVRRLVPKEEARPCLKLRRTSPAGKSASSTPSTTSACCSSPATASRPSTSILPTEIPDKGRVLTGLSGFWFARTSGLVPNHLLALREDGRSTECRRLEMLPIECVGARLPRGLGLEGLPRERRGVRPSSCRRGWSSRSSCRGHRSLRSKSSRPALGQSLARAGLRHGRGNGRCHEQCRRRRRDHGVVVQRL